MASEPPAARPQREVVYESVESLRAQLKEIEDRWNNELKRLDTARKDKEELERSLRVLQAFLEYERAAALKMEEMLKETREALCIPAEAGGPSTKTVYDPSRSAGSSSAGDSSVLEFDLVYNPYAASRVLLETPLVSPPSSLPSPNDQIARSPPLPPTPTKPTPKPKYSPNWKSRITSILISTNHGNRTNPLSPLSNSLSDVPPFPDSADGAEFPGPKPSRAAKSPKRSPRGSEHGATRWRRTMGSAGSKIANRVNRDVGRKSPGTTA